MSHRLFTDDAGRVLVLQRGADGPPEPWPWNEREFMCLFEWAEGWGCRRYSTSRYEMLYELDLCAQSRPDDWFVIVPRDGGGAVPEVPPLGALLARFGLQLDGRPPAPPGLLEVVAAIYHATGRAGTAQEAFGMARELLAAVAEEGGR